MSKRMCWAIVLSIVVSGAAPAISAGQGLETLGTRAAAMAAFVAVADDASAVAWNPAGLVSGPIFNVQISLGRHTERPPEMQFPDAIAGRHSSVLVSLGTTPLGVGYYRLGSTSFVPPNPAVAETPDRQHRQVLVRTLDTHHVGATVQQSIGDYLTLGATLKVVHGRVGVSRLEAATWEDAFEQAGDVARSGSTRGDLDAGAMFAAGRVRAGVVVRNVTAPSFGDGDVRAGLERHVRLGAAWADAWPGLPRTIVSFDADLTRVAHATGERRDLAAGVERWLAGQRLGVRGGVRVSTVDGARPIGSVGASWAIRSGVYVDGFAAGGAEDERAWGLAARLTY